MTAALQRRSFFDVMVGEPLDLIKSQPHQVLLSTGSVALMGQFAGTDRIVDPAVGYLIAVGVEWAYLRGLASDSRAQTAWGAVLNWSAFGIVVLWGVLWVAGLLHAFDPTNGGWLLAAAHVVPVAWLSLCSAQCHRAAMAAERRKDERRKMKDEERERELQAERDRLVLEDQAERLKIERWRLAQEAKHEVARAVAAQPIQVAAPQQPRTLVTYNGVEYPSIQAAADAHGITRQAMSKRLRRNHGGQ